MLNPKKLFNADQVEYVGKKPDKEMFWSTADWNYNHKRSKALACLNKKALKELKKIHDNREGAKCQNIHEKKEDFVLSPDVNYVPGKDNVAIVIEPYNGMGHPYPRAQQEELKNETV